MKRKNGFDTELMEISKYKALKTSRSYLLICLLLLSGYLITLQLAPKSFYIFLVLAIFPSIFEGSLKKNYETPFKLTYLKYSTRYTRKKYVSIQYSFWMSIGLLMIWAINYRMLDTTKLWLKLSPAILIISSLLIVTIGQYYYFFKFRHQVMTNTVSPRKK